MDETTSKIIAIIVLLVETIVCGILPLLLISQLRRASDNLGRLLELANLFAGGVFLATLLLHLMPEANETLRLALEESHIHVDYPVSEIIVAAGFFLIAIIEQLAFSFHHPTHDDDDGEAHGKGDDKCAPPFHTHPAGHESHETHKHGRGKSSHDHDDHTQTTDTPQHQDKSRDNDLQASNGETSYLLSNEKKRSHSSPMGLPEVKVQNPKQFTQSVGRKSGEYYGSITNSTCSTDCSHSAPVVTSGVTDHVHDDIVDSSRKKLTIRSILFFLALSTHSLFEGVAIGLQESVNDVLETLLAVAIHKGVIAFSFTLSMTQQQIIYPIILFYVIFLAVVSPVGISIGIIISESDAGVAADLANGILQSLASGTFLFVIFFEILPRELHCHRRLEGALNLLMTLLGFGLMAGLQAVGSHDHSHDHDGNHTDHVMNSVVPY